MRKKTRRNTKNQDKIIDLVNEHGEISREQLEKELKVSEDAVIHLVHAVRERKINPRQIESFPKKHPKRVYRDVNDARTTAKLLRPVEQNRFLNLITEAKNWKRDGIAMIKRAPGTFIDILSEQQKEVMKALIVE